MSAGNGRPYADPYVAGVGLGLVLLASFVVMGRGLGASGAFAVAASDLVGWAAPSRAESSSYFSGYRALRGAWRWWLPLEVAGVALGGYLSARVAGRVRRAVERGPSVSRGARLGLAFAGGALMGIGAVIARGCTSGLALTGGSLLAVGSWVFMGTAFAAGYALAPLLRRVWR